MLIADMKKKAKPTKKETDLMKALSKLGGAEFNIKLLFSDVCKKRNDEGLEEYYSLGTVYLTPPQLPYV